jgi:hypothetical protein
MVVLFCLTNASFKETVLSVDVADSVEDLRVVLENINFAFLPTPYTVLCAREISAPFRLELIYSILDEFGTPIQGTFYDVSPRLIPQLFDLIQGTTVDPVDLVDLPLVTVVQDAIEYSIPVAEEASVHHYDRLFSFRKRCDTVFSDLDL